MRVDRDAEWIINVCVWDFREGQRGMGGRVCRDFKTEHVWAVSRDFSGSSVEANINAALWILRKAADQELKNITCILHCKKTVSTFNRWKQQTDIESDEAADFLHLWPKFNSCSFFFVDLVCKVSLDMTMKVLEGVNNSIIDSSVSGDRVTHQVQLGVLRSSVGLNKVLFGGASSNWRLPWGTPVPLKVESKANQYQMSTRQANLGYWGLSSFVDVQVQAQSVEEEVMEEDREDIKSGEVSAQRKTRTLGEISSYKGKTPKILKE
ncbi:multidrug resistance-associated protein 3 [Striga asiatica]|uniref:Multidrug resistance-associated protein 3 n=1 Tax=Striga asiatica TaxID=4170 RepID=A0A5A7QYH4_STRAF|nr:multidrug resistance-associated protein 3 [Striga asiatica]